MITISCKNLANPPQEGYSITTGKAFRIEYPPIPWYTVRDEDTGMEGYGETEEAARARLSSNPMQATRCKETSRKRNKEKKAHMKYVCRCGHTLIHEPASEILICSDPACLTRRAQIAFEPHIGYILTYQNPTTPGKMLAKLIMGATDYVSAEAQAAKWGFVIEWGTD